MLKSEKKAETMNDLDVSKIKVVFFDIGGVLLSNGLGHLSRQKAAEVFGLRILLRSIWKG